MQVIWFVALSEISVAPTHPPSLIDPIRPFLLLIPHQYQ